MKRIVLGVVALSLILGYIFWKYSPTLGQSPKETGPKIIKFWTLEDARFYQPVVDAYNQTSEYKVELKQQNSLNYRTRVQTQLRAGQGPDIYWLHSSWVPMFTPDLSFAPVGSFDDFGSIFYPIAKEALVKDGKVLAIPTELDGLSLYVNTEILKGVGAKIPSTWKELIDASVLVTVKNASGQIQTAGVGMGTTSNVDFWSDILGLLFYQQPKSDLSKPASTEASDVIKFYTSFLTDPKVKTWDSTLPSTTQMFVDGKLAFYFAPSSQINVIRSANPALNFQVVSVPQLSGKQVGWGSFASLGVSSYSQNQKEAWKFLSYLMSPGVQQDIFREQVSMGLTPKIYPRTSQAEDLLEDPHLGAYVKQGPYYRAWYLNYKTLDSGINDEIISLYEKVVNQTLTGADPYQSLQSIQPQIQTVLDKYTKLPVGATN